jgi:hypothetical protein
MSGKTDQSEFKVTITVRAAGPRRPRTKYKEHKLLTAETCITLPFVPYPGLYLSFSKPRKRGEPLTLYLRVRTAEWKMAEREFECVADEMLGSLLFDETHEVRGSPRIEEHFGALHKTLSDFGFKVVTDAGGIMALNKSADGTVIEQIPRVRN